MNTLSTHTISGLWYKTSVPARPNPTSSMSLCTNVAASWTSLTSKCKKIRTSQKQKHMHVHWATALTPLTSSKFGHHCMRCTSRHKTVTGWCSTSTVVKKTMTQHGNRLSHKACRCNSCANPFTTGLYSLISNINEKKNTTSLAEQILLGNTLRGQPDKEKHNLENNHTR